MGIDPQLFANVSRFILSRGLDFIPIKGVSGVIYRVAKSSPGAALIGAGVAGAAALINAYVKKKVPEDLGKILSVEDESFSEMLLRKIQERGISNSDCYTKAHIDRRLFSKIISSKTYKPLKKTVFSFAVALEMSIEETNELLMKAGFTFSDSQKFDLIVQYFIKNQIYDIFLINDVLLAYDQPLLGND